MLTAVDCVVKGDDGKDKACEPSGEGIYVDIEPTFGKVVRGSAGAQVNFKLENKYFNFSFGGLETLSPFVEVASGGDIMLPSLIFSDVALAQPAQTELIS